MAIFQSTLFDDVSGSVGNVTMCKRKGKNVAKSKIFIKKKKQSAAQKVQQTRFKTLVRMAPGFRAALMQGCPGKSWSAARNTFIGINQKAVEVDEETLAVTVHMERIGCSSGNLTPPSVRITLRKAKRIIQAEWLKQPLSPVAKDQDNIYIVLYDTGKKRSTVHAAGQRGTPGSTEFLIHKEFSTANIVAYAFAVSGIKTRTSDTMPVEINIM